MQLLSELRVVEPETEEDLSVALRCADRDGLAVIPRRASQVGSATTAPD